MNNYQLKRYKYCENVNLTNNQEYAPDLARSFFMRNIDIAVRAYITDVGGGAGITYTEDAQMKLLKNIQLYTGIDTPINLSGRLLGHMNNVWGRVAPDFDAIPAVATHDAQNMIEFLYRIPFGDEHSRKEAETYLKGWGYNILTLKCQTFDDPEEIIDPDGGALNVDRIEIRIFGEVVDLDQSNRKKVAEPNILIRRLIEQSENIIGDVAYPHDFRNVPLERDKITRALYMLSESDIVGKYGARSDDLLTDLSVYDRGTDIIPMIDEAYLRFQNTRVLNTNLPAGIYYVDCDPEGDHLGLPEPTSKDDFYLRYGSLLSGVGHTDRLIVVQDEFAAAKYVN
jgi:hypothetical protein